MSSVGTIGPGTLIWDNARRKQVDMHIAFVAFI